MSSRISNLRRSRTAFVINSLAGGGAERVMSILLRNLQEQSESGEIHLILLDKEQQAYPVPSWIVLHQLDARGSLLRAVVQVFLCLRRIKPAAILAFLSRSNVACVISSMITRTPCIISERVDTSAHLGTTFAGKLKQYIIALAYRRATKVIAVSDGVAGSLERVFGVDAGKIEVIANPVEVDEIRARAARPSEPEIERPYIVSVGRLVKNKNFALLLRAYAESKIDLDLVILGDGPELAALVELSAQLGISSRVRFLGFMDNPFPLVQRARYYVSASNAEGFPNSLVEAMATGTAVISTNCPSGPSEILADEPRRELNDVLFAKFGILVPQNAVGPMKSAMIELLAEERNAHYRQTALERVRQYTPQRAVARYWSCVAPYLAG